MLPECFVKFLIPARDLPATSIYLQFTQNGEPLCSGKAVSQEADPDMAVMGVPVRLGLSRGRPASGIG